MVRDIITYPTPPSAEYSTDVRKFDNELFNLIDDLKDTITANSLQGLAAYQIGSHFNVVVVKKEDGEFLELINPRIILNSGKQMVKESTAYFPGLDANVLRYDKISVVYQDRDAKDNSIRADGEFSALLQRKIDYTFGSSFINKLSKDEKKLFEQKLEFGVEAATIQTCPTVFKRDYFKKGVNLLSIIMVVVLVVSLFFDDAMQQKMLTTQLNVFFTAFLVNVGYFFYGYYEGKKYTTCTSCQVGNIFGTFAIASVRLFILLGLSYLFLG